MQNGAEPGRTRCPVRQGISHEVRMVGCRVSTPGVGLHGSRGSHAYRDHNIDTM